jgi:S-adenosylmethionine uptake transporter
MAEAVAPAARVPRVAVGALLCLGSWAAFSLQDTLVKSLVVDLPVPEVLFVRSCVIVAISVGFLRRRDWAAVTIPANLRSLALRSALILMA